LPCTKDLFANCGCKGSAFSENNKIFGRNFIKKRKKNRFLPFFRRLSCNFATHFISYNGTNKQAC
jgi:hypothetical protein